MSRWISLSSMTLLTAVLLAGCTPPKKKAPKDTGGTTVDATTTLVKLDPMDRWRAGLLPENMFDGEPKPGGEVTVQLYSDPPSLNTIVDSDWWAARITEHHIYEALVGVDNYDPDYKLVPELAESWEISADNKTFVFKLRHGVTWHDGKPFTADDVIATFDKVQDETTKAAHVRSYTTELDTYEKVDDYTVKFVWKKAYFLALDTPFSDLPIQPAHIIAKLSGKEYNEAATNSLNRAPLGTGPFEFVEWKSNERIVVKRNEAYWGKKAHISKLTFRIVKDATVALQLAQRQELDVVTRILEEDWVTMESKKVLVDNYHRSRFHDANYAWIGWNQKRPFFKDKRVRNAMTLLTNRQGIIDQMMHGLPLPTTCHFYFKSESCDPDLAPLPYDPIKAVKLLDEAGWVDSNDDGIRDKDGVEFNFSFMLPASSVNAGKMATLMKEDFSRAGIGLSIRKVEWSAFVKELRSQEFDACTLVWGGGPRGEPTQIWHSASSAEGSNYISFSNARVDELLEKARVEFDVDKRNEMYREFGRILHDEQPYTFLYVRPRMSLVHKRLKGVAETLSYWEYEDWWVEEGATSESAAAVPTPDAKEAEGTN